MYGEDDEQAADALRGMGLANVNLSMFNQDK